MKKQFLCVAIVAALTTASISSMAQGWVSNSPNTIYPVNASLGITPVTIGIGTNTPSAQLHTTGTLRFANLSQSFTANQLLATDASGNVSWRDASGFGSAGGWLLTGNGSTNPTINFLGTTDNNRLVFRTNNVERATVLANGNVGFGISTPTARNHIYNTVSDNHLFVSGVSPSARFFGGTDWPASGSGGRIGFATIPHDFVYQSAVNDFAVQNLSTTGSLLFSTNVMSVAGVLAAPERMRISPTGLVGIATRTPAARLHVNCSMVNGPVNPSNVRFDSLQSGRGTALVIDAAGYVYRSNLSEIRSTEAQDKEIEQLKQEIESMKADIKNLLQNAKISQSTGRAILYQNNPNPFGNKTVISYSLPDNFSKGYLVIKDQSGRQITQYNVQGKGEGQKTIESGTLSPGVYFYSLYDGSTLVDTKKMVLTN